MAKQGGGGGKPRPVEMSAEVKARVRREGLAIYQRMVAYMEANGIEAKEVARRCKFRETMLSQYKQAKGGGKGPAFGELVLLARALERPLTDFLGPEPPPRLTHGRRAIYRANQAVGRLARDVRRFERVIRDLEADGPARLGETVDGEVARPPEARSGRGA